MPRLSQDNQRGHQKHFSRPSRRIRFLPPLRTEAYNVNVHQTVENEGCATATHNVKICPFPKVFVLSFDCTIQRMGSKFPDQE
ncbi:hypothetical protein FD755_016778 [Muntiacus reevesi]|uniref:Uncharacterized protein n=1 Tax=Muntiacus reevesi TaxID=9886 RepID=A0A5N3XDV3_MUNRE|nr:hypothetical protein FD755_016778 [Muntiacus reevesi]